MPFCDFERKAVLKPETITYIRLWRCRKLRAKALCFSLPIARTHSDQKVASHVAPRLAVFASGAGSNLIEIKRAIDEGRLKASLQVVVSDKPSCGACEYAVLLGLDTITYPLNKADKNGACTGAELTALLVREHLIDYVVLAGYLKLVPQEVVMAFPKAILNIHPSLLPAFGGKGFYGAKVHKAVIASGMRFTGPTVHFVDSEYDTGPILAQRVIPVHPAEDFKQLAARVQQEEHILYPEAIAALVDQRITWRDDGIPVLWQAS